MDQEFFHRRRKQENTEYLKESFRSNKMPKIHPLLIDHVVENVFENLPKGHTDLMQSRVVCRQWEEIATKALMKKPNAILSFGKFRHSAEKISELVHLVESSRNFPFTKFKFCQDIFKAENEEMLREFFEKCSFLIESLMIWLDVESTLVVPSKWIPNLNLEFLKCVIFDDRRRNPEEFGQLKLLENILSVAPNVKKLSLIFPTESRFPLTNNGSSTTNELIELLRSVPPSKLTELKLDMEMDDELLLCLSEIYQKLEMVHLSLRTSKFNSDSLNRFLSAQKLLRTLKLTDLVKGARVSLDFPKLEMLELLEIHGWDNSITNVRMNNLICQNQMPNLQHLLLSTWFPDTGWLQFFPQNFPIHLKKLKLPQGFDRPDLISNISVTLTRLELHYAFENVNVVQSVFKNLKNLQELKLNQSFPGDFQVHNIDFVFTGIPPAECEKLLQLKKYFMSQAELVKLQVNPGLTNLERLTTLNLKDLHYQCTISDVTGYLAILRMKHLRTLIMGRSMIDEQCLEKIARMYPTMKQQLSIPKMKINYDHVTSDLPSKCSIC